MVASKAAAALPKTASEQEIVSLAVKLTLGGFVALGVLRWVLRYRGFCCFGGLVTRGFVVGFCLEFFGLRGVLASWILQRGETCLEIWVFSLFSVGLARKGAHRLGFGKLLLPEFLLDRTVKKNLACVEDGQRRPRYKGWSYSEVSKPTSSM